MNIFNNLHAFVWQSMTANTCNTYLIDGPTRVLIDPGHSRLFDHVVGGLKQLGLAGLRKKHCLPEILFSRKAWVERIFPVVMDRSSRIASND